MARRGGQGSALRHHKLLLVVVLLLPFSYVPYELTRRTINLNVLLFVLVVVLGARYRVLTWRLTTLELLLLIFAGAIVIRHAVGYAMDPVSGSMSLLVRELSKLISAAILYRVSRIPETRPVIVRACMALVVGLPVMGLYQVHEGTMKLIQYGYTSPRFNFATATGSMRPFASFEAPTVYGEYLAVLLAFLAFTSQMATRHRFVRWAILAIGIGGLLITETRSAEVGFAVALGIVWLLQPGRLKARGLRSGGLVVGIGTAVLALDHRLASRLLGRLGTLLELSYTSNADRLTLWRGTIQAVLHSTGPLLFGYGGESFGLVLSGYIPSSVAILGHSHDTYLEVLYLYGLVGVVLLMATLWSAYSSILRARHQNHRQRAAFDGACAALTVFIVSSAFDNLWTTYNFVVTVFLLVGVGSAPFLGARLGSTSVLRIEADLTR